MHIRLFEMAAPSDLLLCSSASNPSAPRSTPGSALPATPGTSGPAPTPTGRRSPSSLLTATSTTSVLTSTNSSVRPHYTLAVCRTPHSAALRRVPRGEPGCIYFPGSTGHPGRYRGLHRDRDALGHRLQRHRQHVRVRGTSRLGFSAENLRGACTVVSLSVYCSARRNQVSASYSADPAF